MTDPIADMLSRIRNAHAVKKQEVIMPSSKIKFGIAKILENEGWVEKAEIVKSRKAKFDELRIVLKYLKNGDAKISSLKRVSKPGLKVYAKKKTLPKVLNNYGIAIISTQEGLMTNKQAKSKGLGGEVVCELY